MDGQTKLTRTNSSLLRSSPTIRSSIHSLSSVSEIAPDSDAEDLEEQKPHSRPLPPPVRRCLWPPPSSSSTRSSRRSLPPPLRALLSRNVNFFKQICDEYGKRLGFLRFASRTHSKPVQWFIGKAESEGLESRKIVRESVEFYSNGDFYAWEFQKGRVIGAVTY
ncbi:hypothetical protein SASPL_115308 [Salvia splendens]|uniref:Uncharacterized protein n=1 Tax=Salvia splendens TaxID=180675 RepID=A0A8X8Y3I1_SALSN|nr:hypothetical protein SASPL_115308 [Salvia splendens]